MEPYFVIVLHRSPHKRKNVSTGLNSSRLVYPKVPEFHAAVSLVYPTFKYHSNTIDPPELQNKILVVFFPFLFASHTVLALIFTYYAYHDQKLH